MKKIHVAVLGCGYWGKNLIRNVAELGCLYAVCDVSDKLASQFATQYECQAMTYSEILSCKEVDAVMIAAPAEMHYTLASECLKHGKHVFVEKPLALDALEGKQLCDMAKSVNRTLMVGHLLQYHSAYRKAKSMVQQGHLGKLHYVYSNRLSLGKFRQEENSLWSFAPHDISMIMGLIGKVPNSVYATGSCHLHPTIEDITTTHLQFDHGIEAHVHVSWLHPVKEQKLVIIGEKGMLVFDDGQEWDKKLLLYSHEIEWNEGRPLPKKAMPTAIELEQCEPLKCECEHFVQCVAENDSPITDGEEGLNVLKILQAAQKSLKQKVPVSLGCEKSDYFAHETAIIDSGASIGKASKIWHFSHILDKVRLGSSCTIGQNVMIGPNVTVGDKCKIQNNVSLYQGVELGKAVFCGPSCVFTNVKNPRAHVDRSADFSKTIVGDYTTIGANATIVCGIQIGAHAFIGAGAVVTKDVPAHALMVGNPAKQVGWVSHDGECLGSDLKCPRSQRLYAVVNNELICEELV